MTDKFDHLYIGRWPFRNVPDDESSRIWAGRPALREQVNKLLWRWTRSDQSTIHLMWADLGAGKSHTLRYIESKLSDGSDAGMHPVYSVMPRELRTFLDVYQAILAGFDLSRLGKGSIEAVRSLGSKEALIRKAFPALPEAASALIALQSPDDDGRRVARQWISGQRGLTRRDLNMIGVTRSIKTTDDAVAALSGIMFILWTVEKTSRLVVMLDEAQRLSQVSNRARQDVNIGLQTWYDSSPKNLTIMLSFGSGDEVFVRHMVSPELQRRQDHERLRLDLLTSDAIVEFVRDLLLQSRSTAPPDEWFPFTRKVVEELAERLGKGQGATAGNVMKAFNAVLVELDYVIGMHGQGHIDEAGLVELGMDAIE